MFGNRKVEERKFGGCGSMQHIIETTQAGVVDDLSNLVRRRRKRTQVE
jgi:hypothetical protein